jgi:tetratricopeptide (TPR) repeat protein
MPLATLERFSVARQKEVERVVTVLRQSILTPAKHHTLFIGPRGIGKTHILSLIYHRLTAERDVQDKIIVAWLREDEWGVSSYVDLIIRILRSVSSTPRSNMLKEDIEALYDLSQSEAERMAENLLLREALGKTLVLFMENLDDIFRGIGEIGQQKFRSFIQENAFISITASTQSLFAGISSQTKPFYGFFNLYHLSPLTFEDALSMLIKIATLKNDEQLVAYLETPEGRSRVRAVHHLIGGNPRLYIVFSDFLSCSTLSNLVTPFMRMLDDLTPYYQERMRWLSPQQRQIIEILCDVGKPLSVKDIAKRAFITHQTASSQLKQLRDMRYVAAKPKGRESFYELTETLMRLAVEVKRNQAEPIRLLVDFLRFWYAPHDLEKRLQLVGAEMELEHDYLELALQDITESEEDPRSAACLRDYYDLVDKEDFARACAVAEELLTISKSVSNWFRKWACANSLGSNALAEEAGSKVLSVEPRSALDWLFRATFLNHHNRALESIPAYRAATQLKPDLSDAWSGLTLALIKVGDFVEARQANIAAIDLKPESADDWIYRGNVFTELKEFDEAAAAYQKVVVLAPDEYQSWLNLGWMYCRFGKYNQALEPLDKAIKLNPLVSKVWVNHGWALAGLGRHLEAISDFDRALELSPNDAMALNNRGFSLIALDRFEEAGLNFKTYSELYADHPNAWRGLAEAQYHLDNYQGSLEAAEKALELNPESAITWSIVGVAKSYLNKFEDALKCLDEALRLGDHSGLTVFHRAVSLFTTGDQETAIRELDHAVQHSCRIHGPDLKSMTHLLATIYREGYESDWERMTLGLVEIFRSYGLSSSLGVILVKTLPQLARQNGVHGRLEQWITAWLQAVANNAEYRRTADLLNTFLQFAKTGEDSSLTTLSSEEKEFARGFQNVQSLPHSEGVR